MSGTEAHASAAAEPQHVAVSSTTETARTALKNGPRGALVIASTGLLLLVAGWLAFYFLLFLPRGAIS